MKKELYEIKSCGNKFNLIKIIGQYDSKEEAAQIKRELLKKESEEKRSKEIEEARRKGLCRYF